ncbi:MAG TPA: PEP-CTERM sorting domain-containing protein [Vicinamibacterales bacterium]
MPKLSVVLIAACALLATATSSFAVTPVPTYSVPEPATGALIVSGVAAWLIARRRKRQK